MPRENFLSIIAKLWIGDTSSFEPKLGDEQTSDDNDVTEVSEADANNYGISREEAEVQVLL